MKKIILIVLAILNINIAFAMGKTGNAGDVLLCKEPLATKPVESVVAMERLELSQIIKSEIKLGSDDVQVNDKIAYALERLEKSMPNTAKEYRETLHELIQNIVFVENELTDVPDYQGLIIPKSCTVHQVYTILQDKLSTDQYTYLIYKPLFERLSNDDMAMILIEMTLMSYRLHHADSILDSAKIRNMAATIASDIFTTYTPKQMIDLLNDHFLPIHEWYYTHDYAPLSSKPASFYSNGNIQYSYCIGIEDLKISMPVVGEVLVGTKGSSQCDFAFYENGIPRKATLMGEKELIFAPTKKAEIFYSTIQLNEKGEVTYGSFKSKEDFQMNYGNGVFKIRIPAGTKIDSIDMNSNRIDGIRIAKNSQLNSKIIFSDNTILDLVGIEYISNRTIFIDQMKSVLKLNSKEYRVHSIIFDGNKMTISIDSEEITTEHGNVQIRSITLDVNSGKLMSVKRSRDYENPLILNQIVSIYFNGEIFFDSNGTVDYAKTFSNVIQISISGFCKLYNHWSCSKHSIDFTKITKVYVRNDSIEFGADMARLYLFEENAGNYDYNRSIQVDIGDISKVFTIQFNKSNEEYVLAKDTQIFFYGKLYDGFRLPPNHKLYFKYRKNHFNIPYGTEVMAFLTDKGFFNIDLIK